MGHRQRRRLHPGVASYIAESGCFERVDSSEELFIPLSTLVGYDAVLYFSNYFGNPVPIGDVLADYADTGRRLVLATFSWANQGPNTLSGRIITDQISPLLVEGNSLYTDVTMATNDGSAYFTGVNALEGHYHDNVTLSAGAVLRGTWSDGEPLLADKGNVVGITLFPDDSWGHIGGDYRRLFSNAMCVGPANHAPDCSKVAAVIEAIWPPNHSFTGVSIAGVTDTDGDAVTITVTDITQDEPLDTVGDGSTCPDGEIVDGVAFVRMERSGTPGVPGNGRVYHVSFTASDGEDTCEGVVTVCVPHDQGAGSVCVDDGPLYDSFGPCKGGSRKSDPDVIAATDLSVRASGRQAVLEYSLADEADVNLSVFDLAGRRMATIENARTGAGSHTVTWEAAGLGRGMYFYRLKAGRTVVTRAVLHAR